MTSNIGSQHIAELGEEQRDEMQRRVEEALRAHFKPEFLNRVDETIVYHQLARENFHKIVDIQLERVKRLLVERRIELEVSDAARELLADRGYDPHYGARPLKRVIQRMLQDPLAVRILEGDFPEGSKVLVDARVSGEALEFRQG
jgi:ATP-dependent Clp protease ATP-binding subunit ClpB